MKRTLKTKRRHFGSIWDDGFAEYFWSRVKISGPGECWEWQSTRNGNGYGKLRVNRRYWRASRLAITLTLGREIGDKFACHHCDNPSCCNPAHLYEGTPLENVRDSITRNRFTNPPIRYGHVPRTAKLSHEDAKEIKRLHESGNTIKEISKRYGVCFTTVWNITVGRAWRSSPAREEARH